MMFCDTMFFGSKGNHYIFYLTSLQLLLSIGASVVSYVAFVFVIIRSFWCLWKAVPRDCGVFLVPLLTSFRVATIKRLPVLHHCEVFLFIYFGINEPNLVSWEMDFRLCRCWFGGWGGVGRG